MTTDQPQALLLEVIRTQLQMEAATTPKRPGDERSLGMMDCTVWLLQEWQGAGGGRAARRAENLAQGTYRLSMTLNISCPNCALNFPLVAGLNEADAKRYAALMGELPPALAKPLTQYLALFKPAKTGLTWSRALMLLGELLPDIRRGQVRRNGRDWPAPADYWSLAIQTMLEQRDKLTLPMRNHGYLYSILSGLADRTEAAQEQRVEAAR